MSDADYDDYHEGGPDDGYGGHDDGHEDDERGGHHMPKLPNFGGMQGGQNQQRQQQQAPPPQHHAYNPRDGYPIPPGNTPHQPAAGADPRYDPNYFPPPPRQEYREGEYDESPREDHRGYDYDQGYGRPPRSGGYNDRPRRGSRGPEENQLAPYDEEKAEAEWRRGYEQDSQARYGGHPPSDYDRYDDRRYDSRDRRYDDRYYDDRPDSRDRYDSRDRRPRHRRDSRQDEGRASTRMKNKPGPDIFGGKEGERGFGAQILGGAAGGLLGHEMGGGLMETIGGAVVGALGAKVAENQLEKRRAKKESSLAGAPFKDQAIEGRPYSHGRTRSPSRYDSRSPPRRGNGRRSRDDYDDGYSRSPPPPRR